MSKNAHSKSMLVPKGLTDEQQKAFSSELRKKFVEGFGNAMLSDKKFLRAMLRIPGRLRRWEVEAIELLQMIYTTDRDQAAAYLIEHPATIEVILTIMNFDYERAKSYAQYKGGVGKAAKNGPAKEFVVNAWLQEKQNYKGKADFARIYAPLVMNKFGIKVIARTIERSWLPPN